MNFRPFGQLILTMRSTNTQLIMTLVGIGLLAGCEEERVPRSTAEFLENPIMLEAAMVRCSQNRTATRYDAECVNARQAVKTIEAEKESARREEAEAQSESKRQALRRTQEAAAQARRNATEAQRLREEAEYLAQFGVALPTDETAGDDVDQEMGNTPLAVIPEGPREPVTHSNFGNVGQATDGGNAPVSVSQPVEEDEPATDLESIRDELQRRNDADDGGD